MTRRQGALRRRDAADQGRFGLPCHSILRLK
jgi:hypothetical protein